MGFNLAFKGLSENWNEDFIRKYLSFCRNWSSLSTGGQSCFVLGSFRFHVYPWVSGYPNKYLLIFLNRLKILLAKT